MAQPYVQITDTPQGRYVEIRASIGKGTKRVGAKLFPTGEKLAVKDFIYEVLARERTPRQELVEVNR